MCTYLQLACMCFWGARREPGAGFFWVGLCLLAVVPLAVGLALAQVHGVVLRYWAVLPILAMQPMLLIVVLMSLGCCDVCWIVCSAAGCGVSESPTAATARAAGKDRASNSGLASPSQPSRAFP